MSKIRGWIYVLSNRAMPGLLKIGFSTKDPALRARELGGTGLPFEFQVEYEALIYRARDVEQQVHSRLAAYREAKEFFRVDIDSAVATIQSVLAADDNRAFVEQRRCGESPMSEKLQCVVCRAIMERSRSRCPNCFALVRFD
jgi:hypothetical protein